MIYLHIGRNKAGSTTLQDFFLKNRAELENCGIRYALYGHLKDSVPGVLGFGRQDEIAAYARARPAQSILISHEWMLHWEAIYVEIMAVALQGLPVKVIAYIRPYPSWVCSNYAQDIRIGESSANFDHYFESFRPQFSVWPDLRRWGELFGWHNIIVRLIDGRNTAWDDLAGDFLNAIGLDPRLGSPVPASNQAPRWEITELLRALAALQAGPAATETLQNLARRWLDADPAAGHPIQYLNPAQALELAELYENDIENIKAHTAAKFITVPIDAPPERPFLPEFRRLPRKILKEFHARASDPDFVSRHPEAADVAQRLLQKPFGVDKPGIAAAIRNVFKHR